MTQNPQQTDVVIIGAGPAGAVAGALLLKAGISVVILEKQQFPRFSIGESLLPQCMEFLAQAGLEDTVHAAGFQFKNGAAFAHGDRYDYFDFTDKFSPGPGTTYQVQRARFDHLLAEKTAAAGAQIRYRHTVNAVEFADEQALLSITDEQQEPYQIRARFVLDASGFGRVLPRLLGLEQPIDMPPRRSVFTHVEDRITSADFDRNKILITVHPQHRDLWFWLIPFNNGRASIGVSGDDRHFEGSDFSSPEQTLALLQKRVDQADGLSQLLADARWDTPASTLSGYACSVRSLHGPQFALLGNAGEFLDPVFSSGVTIAMKSATLAAPLVARQLRGETVDWQSDYADPLKAGVDTFRTFVEAWYDERFQDVVFYGRDRSNPDVRAMISSILAGYAWDTSNPYVTQPERRLNTLVELCRA